MEIEFRKNEWKCYRCGGWNKLVRVYKKGSYIKTCICGAVVLIKVRIKVSARYMPEIMRCIKYYPEDV